MTAPNGRHWLGGVQVEGAGLQFTAIAPVDGAALSPTYRDASHEQVAVAAAAAASVQDEFAATPAAQRAALLDAIAAGLLGLGDPLVQRVEAETGLPRARIEGERGRTVLQLRQFAALLRDGSWVDARIDRADRARQPLPKPDLRSMLAPLGPVAVFGASNFPLAYSVAGGDTASALAAGCPVVVKGHPAHPGTSELVGGVVATAVREVALPAAVFALLHGKSHAVGAALVQHPAMAAVGFTGSYAGGRALFDLAAARPLPIPVFAEMGSMNPVVVLPQAMATRGAAIAAMVAASAAQACGQFCTSPGIVLCLDEAATATFAQQLATAVAAGTGGPLVHPTIRHGFERALGEVQSVGATVIAQSPPSAAATGASPMLLEASGAQVLAQPRLRHEIYGPALLLVRCRDAAELAAVVAAFDGQLTATVHGEAVELRQHAALLRQLLRRVGRLIVNGVPTGVEVCPSMVHGGPWPASTDARFSAVGITSIRRWARPVCFQDVPDELLPDELRDGNPRGIWRLVDGVLGRH